MNGLTAMIAFNNIDDRYVEAAFLPSAAAADAAVEKPRRRSSFMNTEWAAAVICVVVGIGVYVTLLGLGRGWFAGSPAGDVSGTETEETEPTETETEAATELVVNCPAEGVYLARTDKLSLKREVRRAGAMPILEIINGISFKPGQPDIRADLVLMVDGTYYLYRSATGEINDPAGGRTAVLSEEDRVAFNEYYESSSIKTGFADELIQITDADMLDGLKRFILENGTPCTVYRRGDVFLPNTPITHEPHCIQYRGASTVIMTVDSETGCVVVYFGENATLTFRENGDLYFRMHSTMEFEHITGRGQPYDHHVTNVGHHGSGGSEPLPWEMELYYLEILDTAFRRGWGLNVSLKSLGYMIDEYTH